MNHVCKIKIVKPIGLDWSIFKILISKLQNETRSLMNKTIDLMREYDGFSSEYKKRFNEYPKDTDTIGKKIQSYPYYVLVSNNEETIGYSSNLSHAVQDA